MKGDIIPLGNGDRFYELSRGSIVKILDVDKEGYKEYIGCYVIRCNEKDSDDSYGVTIYHEDGVDLGEMWGDIFNSVSFEILKEV